MYIYIADNKQSIMTQCISEYDEEAKESVNGLPSLVCVITGKRSVFV